MDPDRWGLPCDWAGIHLKPDWTKARRRWPWLWAFDANSGGQERIRAALAGDRKGRGADRDEERGRAMTRPDR